MALILGAVLMIQLAPGAHGKREAQGGATPRPRKADA